MIMSYMNEIHIEHVMPPSDKKRLKKILLRLDEAIIPKLSERVDLDEYVQKLSERAELFYVINRGEDIGNCAIYLNRGTYGFISSIAILKEWKGLGIGKLLWNHVLERSMEKQVKTIELMVHQENYNAMKFYAKAGFRIVEQSEEWSKMRYEF